MRSSRTLESGAWRASVDVDEIEQLINEIERGNCWRRIRFVRFLWRTLPVAKAKQEASMAKIDLDSLNIEELALLRDRRSPMA